MLHLLTPSSRRNAHSLNTRRVSGFLALFWPVEGELTAGNAAVTGVAVHSGDERGEGGVEFGEFAGVDPTVVELRSELARHARPVAVPGHPHPLDRRLDDPLHHLNCRSARGGGSGLFPGALPAGGGAPLRDAAGGLISMGSPHQAQLRAASRRDAAAGVAAGSAVRARRARSRVCASRSALARHRHLRF